MNKNANSEAFGPFHEQDRIQQLGVNVITLNLFKYTARSFKK